MAVDLAPIPVTGGNLDVVERTFDLHIQTPGGQTPMVTLGREKSATIGGVITPISRAGLGYRFLLDQTAQAIPVVVDQPTATALGLNQTQYTLGQVAAIIAAACDAAAAWQQQLRAPPSPQ